MLCSGNIDTDFIISNNPTGFLWVYSGGNKRDASLHVSLEKHIFVNTDFCIVTVSSIFHYFVAVCTPANSEITKHLFP